jgi:hypothetical protein
MRKVNCRGCGALIELDPALLPWCGSCAERKARQPITNTRRLCVRSRQATRSSADRCNTPHPELDARIEWLAERAARGLPLFDSTRRHP